MKKKRYDPTLARIAGNIASGMVKEAMEYASPDPKEVAREAMTIALHIVKLAKKEY